MLTRTIKTKIKRLVASPGVHPIKIKSGIGKGLVMSLDPDHRTQRILGLEENEIAEPFKKAASMCKSFVDIGANDGFYSLVYRKFNTNGQIILCEPQDELQDSIKGNFNLNHFNLGNVVICKKFVMEKDSNVHVTIDSLLKDLADPVFIKMDIDGGELDALKGGKKSLESKKCFLIVETHSKELEVDCIKFLKSLGYACNIIYNAWWRLFIPEVRPIEHNRWFIAKNY